MLLLFLLALPAAVQAQSVYTNGLIYTSSGYKITITGYAGPGGSVAIPDRIPDAPYGLPVTSIGGWAFANWASLASVTIPNSVINIGDAAFAWCTGLTNVTIPDSVTNIGGGMFIGCTNLTSITIPDSVTSIGDSAFVSCTRLTKFTIPNSVTHIGDSVFEYCYSLTNVTMGNSVTSIGNSAFGGCASLTSVTIANSVTSIGNSAFWGCTSLSSVTIPDNVTSIGDFAFDSCTRLANVTIPNSVTRIGNWAFEFCDSLTSVTIGSGVTSIGDGAFWAGLTSIAVDSFNSAYNSSNGVLFNKGQTRLIQYPIGNAATSYTIPNSVTNIGCYAFAGCSSLTSVTIPSSVVSIGDSAFDRCARLTSVTLPDSVTYIGDSAFESCTRLTKVKIGSGVTSIGHSAFYRCTSLTNITVDPFNPAYSSLNGVLFNKGQTMLIQYPFGIVATSYTIPSGVTSIGDDAFDECTRLTSITIPDSVTTIGNNTFQYCSGLTNVTMGGGVTGIGKQAFAYCFSLTDLTIPNRVTSIGDGAFFYSTSLRGVYFPGNAPSLGGSSVFAGDDHVTVYYLPGTAGWGTTYGGRPTAVWNLSVQGASTLSATGVSTNGATLNGIVNPDGYPTTAWFQWGTTTQYGNLTAATGMGSGTNGLPLSAPLAGLTPGVTYHFRVAATNDYRLVYGSDQSFTTLILPTVVTLPATAIATTNATLNGTVNPNSLPTTGWFQWGTTTNYGNVTSVTDLGSGTSALPLSALLAGLTPSTAYHFRAVASNLYRNIYGSDQSFTTESSPSEFNYTITNGTVTITKYTGSGDALTIPNTINGLPVTSIGGYLNSYGFWAGAFYQCSSLTSVTIPSSVTSIGENAFIQCTSLTSVTIPNSVTSIGAAAFSMCALTSITIPNSITSIADGMFEGCNSLTNVTIPNSVTNIGFAAFDWCQGLTSVAIPSSVTSIGGWAFLGCISLRAITVDALNPVYSSVDGVWFNKNQTTLIQCPGGKTGSYTIPNSVTNLSDAFRFCFYLSSITIPDTVSKIEDLTFQECLSLTNVTIPNSVTSIGGSAFDWCSSLTSITIPYSVTSIGDNAFHYCTSLRGAYFQGDAPSPGSDVFRDDINATVYYLPGTSGWGSTYGGRPTALWLPPTIKASPLTQTAEAGSETGFRVEASGLLPLFYLWHLNNTNLIGWGTNHGLKLTNLQFSQSGAYTVVVTNAAGAVTSAPALLQVVAPVERRPVPGLQLMGGAGGLLSVDVANPLSATPDWLPLDTVTLGSAPQYYFDLSEPLPWQRFYRARQTGTPGVLPSLELHMVPAISLTGNIGGSVRVDGINQFGPIDAWFVLDTVTLTNTSQLYFDTSAWWQPPRLYRLVQSP